MFFFTPISAAIKSPPNAFLGAVSYLLGSRELAHPSQRAGKMAESILEFHSLYSVELFTLLIESASEKSPVSRS
ncbi:hypothetical protein CEXT_387721 [Caerostris extrusa]|uniref:Uncharacterized protein n=1 Tax=Caerostris extrusa TaxID=172846 RepID=A0AAV4QAZ6_CAEEX|nr:hypothetical protein CEXT_387721 [Caerostris extrusa]